LLNDLHPGGGSCDSRWLRRGCWLLGSRWAWGRPTSVTRHEKKGDDGCAGQRAPEKSGTNGRTDGIRMFSSVQPPLLATARHERLLPHHGTPLEYDVARLHKSLIARIHSNPRAGTSNRSGSRPN
jgi:hypothetical protein